MNDYIISCYANYNKDDIHILSKTGDIVPCCIIGDEKVESFGNIYTQEYDEIWNSERYLNFRKQIKQNEIPEYCKNCYKEFKN